MADENKDPFAGFQSEGYANGERTEAPKAPANDGGDDADRGDKSGRGQGAPDAGGESSEDRGGAGEADDPFDLSEFSDEPAGGSDGDGEPDSDNAGVDDEDAEDDDQDDEDDAQGDDPGDADDDQDDDQDDRKRRKKPARDRIAEITRARRQAERELAQERAQKAELVRRIEALERGDAPQDAGKETDDKKPAADAPEVDLSDLKKPDPSDYDFGEVDADYLAAMVEYSSEVKVRKREAEAAKARQQDAAAKEAEKLKEGWTGLSQKGLELHDDFEEVVLQGAKARRWALSKTMAALLPGSDVGAQIAYHLARNPNESARVAGLSDVEQARYFGRIEAKFLAQQRASKGKDDSTNTKRLRTPRKQARGAGGQFTRTDGGGDFASFEKRVNEQEKRAARR